jgi:membrane protein implicated in regulation of membrane protease activity
MAGIEAHWIWLAGGIVLLALETLLPGVFLFWVGLAAVATGLILWGAPLTFAPQLVLFAALGGAAIYVGWRIQGRQKEEVTDAPFLNERGREMIGKVLPLETGIVNGTGSVRIGDSVWRVTGEDRAAGEKVRIAGIEGGTLKVEAA